MLKHILFTCLLSFSVTPLLKAQNCGNDEIYHLPYKNTYKISNAIHADGTEANLQYIDFIKVQCGVLAKSGWLGEVSTEVFSFEDLTK